MREQRQMLPTPSRITMTSLAVMLGLLLLIPVDGSYANSSARSKMSLQDYHAVQVTAERFARRFRETLDFGTVFDELFVADPVARRRAAELLLNANLTQELAGELSDQEIEGAFVALMNVYYLKALYDLTANKPLDLATMAVTPPDVAASLRTSHYFRALIGADDDDIEEPAMGTREEVAQFVAEANHIASLYRKYLTPHALSSKRYKENLRRLWPPADKTPRLQLGFADFNLNESVSVFIVEREVFQLFVIKEAGNYSVLTVGIGH